MNIAFGTDSNLLKQACVMLTSLQLNNKNESINIYAFLLDITEDDKKLLSSSIIAPNSLTVYEIHYYDLDSLALSSKYLSAGIYLRLFIEEKIDLSVKKILYLDSDIVVCQDISTFYNTDLSGFSIAACYDLEVSDIRRYNKLNYDMLENYFNSGVMLVNLEYWRKNYICRKTFEYLKKNNEVCFLPDQDALNHVLHGTVKYVSSRYNVLCDFFNANLDNFLISNAMKARILPEIQNPAIIHYAGFYKPWYIEYHKYNFPFGKLWKKYLKLSKISYNMKHIRFIDKWTLKNIIKLFLLKVGLKKNCYPTFVSTERIEKKLL